MNEHSFVKYCYIGHFENFSIPTPVKQVIVAFDNRNAHLEALIQPRPFEWLVDKVYIRQISI